MAYLWTVLASIITNLTTVCDKTYMRKTNHVKTNVDLYLLFIYPLMTVYYFLLAGGKVPLNVPTFLFSLVFSVASLFVTKLKMLAYNHATIVYITVFSGASMILPFFYELLFLESQFRMSQYIAVGLRILAVCIPLFFLEAGDSISSKGLLLCLLLFLVSGSAGVITRMFSTHPKVLSDGSFFFWINVLILPSAVLGVLRKARPKELYGDFKQIKFRYFLLMLIPAIINNAINFISIELIRQVTSTVYSILTGTAQILVSAFLSVVIYREKLSCKAALSLVLSLGAAVLSLL